MLHVRIRHFPERTTRCRHTAVRTPAIRMDWIVETIWGPLLGAGAMFAAGFFCGRSFGLTRGADRVIARVKGLMIKGKIDFDVEQFLRNDRKKHTV